LINKKEEHKNTEKGSFLGDLINRGGDIKSKRNLTAKRRSQKGSVLFRKKGSQRASPKVKKEGGNKTFQGGGGGGISRTRELPEKREGQ